VQQGGPAPLGGRLLPSGDGGDGDVAATPLRPPPRLRKGTIGQLAQISASLGRNKKSSSCLGTLDRYRQEVKSMNKMN
jgi:hypothetical protein